MKGELDLSLLIQYIESKMKAAKGENVGGRTPTYREIVENRGNSDSEVVICLFENRFPRDKWEDCIDFLKEMQEDV